MTSPNEAQPGTPEADTSDPSRADASDADRSLGPRGWLLVAAVLIAFIGVPLVILYRPPALPFFYAYLALPLIPAFLLAALAVWAALSPPED
ncbi:MAG: hypothetical protein R3324_20735 [Halobacteriales archaeon]|nr:hypothetical protein [Halobacteriales archaeon]